MMNFKYLDELICVDPDAQYLVRGAKYTVAATGIDPDGDRGVILYGCRTDAQGKQIGFKPERFERAK